MTSLTLRKIFTDSAPAPFGHYAQAIGAGGLIFVSGQLAPTADGRHLADQPFEVQARQAMQNLVGIVEAGGSSRSKIVKVTAYIVGVEHWPVFDAVYASVLGEWTPARSVVPVPELHHGYLIEIDAIAAV